MSEKPADRLVTQSVKCNQCGAAVGACVCVWDVGDVMPIATHSGMLRIGGIELRCHVLSNGQRIIDLTDELRELIDGAISLNK